MSGFEIAGVVLGSLPLLCDTAKEVAGFLRKTRSWWQFETTFENFVSNLSTQEAAYTLVLRRVLDPLDISDSEFAGLLGNPQCKLWHEIHVQDALRQRLSSEYRWFMWNLFDLNQAVLDLQELLPLNKLHHLDSSSLESEMYRLQTTFSSDKDRLLDRISHINNDLHQYLDRESAVTRKAVAKPKGDNPIELCNLAGPIPNDCKDALVIDGRRKITFKPEPVDQSPFGISSQQTFDTFLRATSMRYSRLYMGLRFALTLLSLATSAWIPSKLAKDDVFLVCSEAGGQTTKPFGPFFAKSSRDLQPPSHTAQHKLWNAKSTLLLLGIVLLELFHGETLESQASWAESLDENGQPNEMTMFCGAFLWVGRAQKSMKEYIGEDLGGGLYEAIRKCICFDFDREDDFGDSRFAELVY
ncbi:hypothetical protein CGCF415_v004359 [Colletotrichum fructicola]|nr:hypothetical protein CGCF415_v004359 [Colletotrichum fructicola]KAF4939259.1 hypothetical protein CGCF245_v003754 [Colletotrichum fructicola]